MNAKIKNIPLKDIKPNPEQPRRYFDPDKMDLLTRSVERYGIINPITVYAAKDGGYELISGERRYRAAFYAGLEEIPCIVLDTDGSDCAVLSLLENLHREDLSFLEIAESYRELVKKKGYSINELSRCLCGRAFDINEKMSLMQLEPLVRKYIRNFHLTERQARAILRVRDKDRRLDATRRICENGLSEKETKEYISGLLKAEESPNVRMNKLKDMRMLKNTITRSVALLKKGGIDADLQETRTDTGVEFRITVKTTD